MSFNGGDGSYKRVLSKGITLGISNDPPYTFQDESTKEYDGIDVRIFREICKRLAITNVKWEIVQFDALIPGIGAKRLQGRQRDSARRVQVDCAHGAGIVTGVLKDAGEGAIRQSDLEHVGGEGPGRGGKGWMCEHRALHCQRSRAVTLPLCQAGEGCR